MASNAAMQYDKHIIQSQGVLINTDRSILIANSEGLMTQDRSVRTRIAVDAIASNGAENQSGGASPGRLMGLELFENTVDPEKIGIHAAHQAITNLEAVYCPAGKMTVAIENGFGGVIFHEACGHSLEATSVAVGASQMAGKRHSRSENYAGNTTHLCRRSFPYESRCFSSLSGHRTLSHAGN